MQNFRGPSLRLQTPGFPPRPPPDVPRGCSTMFHGLPAGVPRPPRGWPLGSLGWPEVATGCPKDAARIPRSKAKPQGMAKGYPQDATGFPKGCPKDAHREGTQGFPTVSHGFPPVSLLFHACVPRGVSLGVSVVKALRFPALPRVAYRCPELPIVAPELP